MSTIIKISGKHDRAMIEEGLKKLSKKRKADLTSFYGALPNTYGDGLTFQEKVRHEWE